ncbi:MAG: sialidase family protein [Planctomycetota bacterium]|jgi:hypothetical protein
MRFTTTTLSVLALSAAASAQTARDLVSVEPGAGTFTPAIASDGDLSAILITDSGDVRISTSDGRGLTWSTPVSITSGGASFSSTRNNHERMLAVVGNSIYAVWQDNRNDDGVSPAENDLFLAVSNDGGATFAPEIVIPKGAPAGTGALRNFRLRVAPGEGGNPDLVYVLQSIDPSTVDEELYLTVSIDGGGSFLPAVLVPQGGAGDVDEIAFDVDGDNVYVAFVDDRAGTGFDDLYFQRSTDRGQTWQPTDASIDGTGPGLGDVADTQVDVVVQGSKVAVCWAEEDSGTGNEILHLTVSNDSGVTFGPVYDIGGYTPVTHDVDVPTMVMTEGGRIYIVWEDNRTGSDRVYVAATDDDGATFTESEVSLADNAAFPQIIAREGSETQVFVQWTEDVGTDDELFGTYSVDGGASFGTPARLTPVGTDSDFGFAAVNPLYNNFLVVTEQENTLGSDETNVGGFRGQDLDIGGFNAGMTVITLGLENYDSPAVAGSFGAILGSASTGDLLLPEAATRNLGITFDAVTNLTLSLPFTTPNGPGLAVSADLPAGLTWSFVGIGIGTGSGALFGDITDVVTVSN